MGFWYILMESLQEKGFAMILRAQTNLAWDLESQYKEKKELSFFLDFAIFI